jgi:hypothetical protein
VPVVLPDACQEPVEVGAGELPAEGPGGGVVVLLEGEDLGGELVEVLEVVAGGSTWLSQEAWTGRWTICAFG